MPSTLGIVSSHLSFSKFPVTDLEIDDYISRVEAADGQSLEESVKDAYRTFFKGCYDDGLSSKIKSCCIMAGARTHKGALVSVAGLAPTNFNFTQADYDRKTGLVTDGTKYLLSNFNNLSRIIDSSHTAIYLTQLTSVNYRWYIGNAGAARVLGSQDMGYASAGTIRMYGATTGYLTKTHSVGFLGINRSNLTAYTARTAGSTTSSTKEAEAPEAYNIPVFAVWDKSYAIYSVAATNARISFYSIGDGLADMTLFDTRISTLMSELNTAIL